MLHQSINSLMQHYQKICQQFLRWARPKLGIRGAIRVRLINRPIRTHTQGTFGYCEPSTKRIVISCENRHVNDVLRTLAHELVHLAQHQLHPLTHQDGVTGSHAENEANALAGILMRLWLQRL